MQLIIGTILKLLPLIFGIGFLGPVLAQAMIAAGLDSAFGLAPLTFGLAVGGAWGLFATVTGRWV